MEVDRLMQPGLAELIAAIREGELVAFASQLLAHPECESQGCGRLRTDGHRSRRGPARGGISSPFEWRGYRC